MGKLAVICPAGTVTVGTDAASSMSELVSVATVPPLGAAALSVTVHVADPPPPAGRGADLRRRRAPPAAGGGGGGGGPRRRRPARARRAGGPPPRDPTRPRG